MKRKEGRKGKKGKEKEKVRLILIWLLIIDIGLKGCLSKLKGWELLKRNFQKEEREKKKEEKEFEMNVKKSLVKEIVDFEIRDE